MTDDERLADELEALWVLPPVARRRRGLSPALLAKVLAAAGGRPFPRLLERARVELELRYAGDAIDVWEYNREHDELNELVRRGRSHAVG